MNLAEEVRAWIAEQWRLDLTVGEWWRRLAAAGLAYPQWPAGTGGRGLSGEDARVIARELAAANVVAPPTGHVAATLAAPTILEHGTAAQVATFLPPISSGQAAWCQLFSEPGAGSDLASVSTRAWRDGARWRVSGQKVWNSGADSAQWGMLLARTDPDAPKHHGLTYFLLEMDQPGIEVRPLRQMNGLATFCEVFITDATVADDHVLGQVDHGWGVARTTLNYERRSVTSRGAHGLAPARSGPTGDLDRPVADILERARRAQSARITGAAVPARLMRELAHQRECTDDPVVRQALARYDAQTKVNAWTARRVAAAAGRLTGADGSLAKLATSRICQDSRDLSFAILGAEAMLHGEIQEVGLGSPGTRIGGGTDEIQLTVIGEQALGLPRD